MQGVCYRAETMTEANRRGLSGWVQNETDGSVTAEVEGASAIVDELIAWCRKGPSWAQVRDVSIKKIAPQGDRARFLVRP